METVLLLIQIFALLWLSALASGSETGLYSCSRVRLRLRCEQGHPRAQRLATLLSPFAPTIIAVLIWNNLANQLLAGTVERSLAGLGSWSVVLTVLLLTPLLILTGEFLPKHLFRLHADRWMEALAWVWTIARWCAMPAILVLRGLIALLERMVGEGEGEIFEPHSSRPNLRRFLSDERGALSPLQRALVDRMLALERMDLSYDGVSRPLVALASIDAAASVEAARSGLGPTWYQRYVVRDHNSGHALGYVTATDLVLAEERTPVGTLVRPMPVLDIDMPLHEAIDRLHAAGADLALIRDGDHGRPQRVAFRSDCMRVLTRLDD